jgi:hypothetical protein
MSLDFSKLKDLLKELEEFRFECEIEELDVEEIDCHGEWDGVEETFRTFEDYQKWAMKMCKGKTVAAVDGGQINPERSFYPPIGLVQSAGFVNFNNGEYEKIVEMDLVIPESETLRFEELTSLRRFSLECKMIKEIMKKFGDRDLFIFYDGSLIASFLVELSSEIRREYLRNINEVLELSEKMEIPIIGYVDLSYARDILNEIERIKGRKIRGFDAMLMAKKLKKWGDSSPVFIAKREITEEYSTPICYTYFLKSAKVPPSRIDFPHWMRDMKREIVNLVLSQCIFGGGGYPYVLESADSLAHIGRKDRERFQTMISRILSSSRSFKSESKRLRRR